MKRSTGLRQLAKRNVVLALILFIVVLAIMLFSFFQASGELDRLESLSSQQVRLEKLRASLPDVLLPLSNYVITHGKSDASQAQGASREFLRLYAEVASMPDLTDKDHQDLADAADLMKEANGIAGDVTSGAIHDEMAGNVTVVAHSLVVAAQKKTLNVINRLSETVAEANEQAHSHISLLALVNLLLILVLLGVLFFLARAFSHAVSGSLSAIQEQVSDIVQNIATHGASEHEGVDQAASLPGFAHEISQVTDLSRRIINTMLGVEKVARDAAQLAMRGTENAQDTVKYMERMHLTGAMASSDTDWLLNSIRHSEHALERVQTMSEKTGNASQAIIRAVQRQDAENQALLDEMYQSLEAQQQARPKVSEDTVLKLHEVSESLNKIL